MSDDARAELVRAAHRTLATRGVRFRATSWWDPRPEGVTDVNSVTDGEVDLRSGWWRTTTRHPEGSGCTVVLDRIGERLARIPVLGRRLLEDDDGEQRLQLLELRQMGDGRRIWSWYDGAWRTAVEPKRPARPLSDLELLLLADDAQDEGSDQHGRRLRWRAIDELDVTRLPLVPASSVVFWGWAWLDEHGSVRRVLGTRTITRGKRPTKRRTWTLLEVVEVDADLMFEEPATAPWPERAS